MKFKQIWLATASRGYREELEKWLELHNLGGLEVCRPATKGHWRFYALHHVGVFPSIHPEAFGIVAAEMMASGLAVVSSGVGGAGELIEDGKTGLRFKAGDSKELASCLKRLARDATLLQEISHAGQKEARQRFSVMQSAAKLEAGFKLTSDPHQKVSFC